ncbi:hypothetical protein pb186bvf_000386 [Paramecium bursaria]
MMCKNFTLYVQIQLLSKHKTQLKYTLVLNDMYFLLWLKSIFLCYALLLGNSQQRRKLSLHQMQDIQNIIQNQVQICNNSYPVFLFRKLI